MSLHVSGQEAQSCLAYLERALQKWEREQIHARQLIATQSRAPGRGLLKKSRTQRKKEPRVHKKRGRQWTPEQVELITRAVKANAKPGDIAKHFPDIPYSTVWYKAAEIAHSLKLSHRRGATSFLPPVASAPATAQP